MEKQKKKADAPEIDEAFLLSMMAKEEGRPPQTAVHLKEVKEKEVVPKEETEPRKKRPRSTDYESLFLKSSSQTARYGKAVYIRKEFHERMQRIVQALSDTNVSLSDYLDNVLAQHFDTYKEEIREVYDRNSKPII